MVWIIIAQFVLFMVFIGRISFLNSKDLVLIGVMLGFGVTTEALIFWYAFTGGLTC